MTIFCLIARAIIMWIDFPCLKHAEIILITYVYELFIMFLCTLNDVLMYASMVLLDTDMRSRHREGIQVLNDGGLHVYGRLYHSAVHSGRYRRVQTS